MTDATAAQPPADDTAPMSFEQGVEDITGLLTDPATPDLQTEDQGQAEDVDDNPGEEPGPDDVEANAEDEQQDDGSEEIKASGRFVSRDAKIKLDDGSVITVGELARNNLYQRDYTRKTEELKQERQAFQAKAQEVDGFAQSLAQQRDFLLSVAPKFLPQPPDPAMMDPKSDKYDPLGFQHAAFEYQQKVGDLNQIFQINQAEQARLAQETTAQRKQREKEEADKLLSAVPEFRDGSKYQQFWRDAVDVMGKAYGFTPEELNAIDHRYYLAMRDLVAFHKAKRQAPKVQEQVQKKPAMLKGSVRMDPKAKTSRDMESRKERLRSSNGDFDAGVAAIEALIS